MLASIDGRPLTCEPTVIDIVPAGFAEHPTPDGNLIVVEDQGGVTVNFNYEGTNIDRVLVELQRRRINFGVHLITFEDTTCRNLVNINAYMARVNQNPIGYATDGRLAYSAFTVVFKQVRPSLVPVLFELWARGTITTGDGKYKHAAPAAGRIFSIDGYVKTLGTGAGQTRVQVSNGGTDYLSTPGDFVVASGTNLMENQVLGADLDFIKGDILELDVDGIPGGGDSADACVRVWALVFRP